MKIQLDVKIILGIVLLFNFVLLFKSISDKKEIENYEQKTSSLNHSEEMLTLLKGNMLKSFDFYKRDFNGNQIVFDNKGNKSELINYFFKDKTLILYIPKYACDLCYINQLQLLDKYFSAFQENILILTTMDFDLYKLRFANSLFYNRFYFVSDILEKEDQQLIYYFLVENGTVSNVFFPLREFQDISHEYLQMVIARLK